MDSDASFFNKKGIFSLTLVFVAAVYVIWLRMSAPASNVATTPTTPSASSTPVTGSAYADGTYTGAAVNAYYGILQVQAVIRGGKIADVVFLQYAHDQDTSILVNTRAMPLLIQEAIQAQSATVDGVSGATATSAAFTESLKSALAQASA